MYIGPSNDSSVDYLLVADYNQQRVYQLLIDTEELRSFSTTDDTVAMALDPRRRIVYLAYETNRSSEQYQIRKMSFDGKINSVIYYASSGTVTLYHVTIMWDLFVFVVHLDLTVMSRYKCDCDVWMLRVDSCWLFVRLQCTYEIRCFSITFLRISYGRYFSAALLTTFQHKENRIADISINKSFLWKTTRIHRYRQQNQRNVNICTFYANL